MPTTPRSILLCVAVCVSIGVFAQPGDFVGTWQIRPSRLTGKSNITVNVIQSVAVLGGTVVVVNPDRTVMTLKIVHPSIESGAFRFETSLDNEPIYWSLALDQSKQGGMLEGRMREMLVKEKVTKKLRPHPTA